MAKKDEVDLNRRTLEYIYEMIVRQQARFVPDKYGEYAGEIWGKLDGGYIYIIKSVFDRELSAAGYHPNSFVSWALRRGLLKCDKGHTTLPVRFNGNKVRCVAIKHEAESTSEDAPEVAEEDDLGFPF